MFLRVHRGSRNRHHPYHRPSAERRTSSYSFGGRVAEDVVGRRDLLETVFGTRIGVRVVLLGQLAVRLGDLLVRRGGRDP